MPRTSKLPSSPRKSKKAKAKQVNKVKKAGYSDEIKGKVIDLVRAREELWNTKNKDYSNRTITDQIWDSFKTELNLQGRCRDI